MLTFRRFLSTLGMEETGSSGPSFILKELGEIVNSSGVVAVALLSFVAELPEEVKELLKL